MAWMSRCVMAVSWEVDGCGMDKWRQLVKAFVRLLNEIIERIKWEGEKVIYNVCECDIIIIRIVEDVKKELEFGNVIGFVFVRDLTYRGVGLMNVGACEEEVE